MNPCLIRFPAAILIPDVMKPLTNDDQGRGCITPVTEFLFILVYAAAEYLLAWRCSLFNHRYGRSRINGMIK